MTGGKSGQSKTLNKELKMNTTKSDFTENGGHPGLVIQQDVFDENRLTKIRIIKDHANPESTFQLTFERYNKHTGRNKPFICIDFDEDTTVQIYHLIGNALHIKE